MPAYRPRTFVPLQRQNELWLSSIITTLRYNGHTQDAARFAAEWKANPARLPAIVRDAETRLDALGLR